MFNYDALRELKITPHIAVTAEVSANGQLLPIKDVFDKLVAALSHAYPPVRLFLVAQGQDLGGINTTLQHEVEGGAIYGLRDTAGRIIQAENLELAASLALQVQRTELEEIPDYGPELERHSYLIGREWLIKEIKEFVQKSEGGCFVIKGGIGYGKSALIAHLVRYGEAILPSDDLRLSFAYHFIRQDMADWADPEVICKSLVAQLRRSALRPDQTQFTNTSAMPSLLSGISRTLFPNARVIIFIDGVDAALGQITHLLPHVLPKGIKAIITSRTTQELYERSAYKTIDLQRCSDKNRADIREYVDIHGAHLDLESEFSQRLVESCADVFAVAVLMLRERPGLKEELERWQADPGMIPSNIEEWETGIWSNVVENARRRHSLTEFDVIAILGLLAVAEEPLEYQQLESLWRSGQGAAGLPKEVGLVAVNNLSANLTKVLDLAQDLFTQNQANGVSTARRYQFFHQSFREFVLDKLLKPWRIDCNRLWQHCCSQWRDQEPAAREYSLRFRTAHAIHSQQWKEVCRVFADREFIERRISKDGPSSIHGDALAALTAVTDDLTSTRDDRTKAAARLWHESIAVLERFLRLRIERLTVDGYWHELRNELSAPRPLDELLQQAFDADPIGIRVIKERSSPPALQGAGHTSAIGSLAVPADPDATYLASASEQTVKIWDFRKGWVHLPDALVADCQGHRDRIRCIAFSTNGKLLVSGSDDNTVKVWESHTGRMLVELPHEKKVLAISFCSEDKLLATAMGDGLIYLWNCATWQRLRILKGHTERVTVLKPSPDGQLLASASADHTCRLWSLENDECRAVYEGHTDKVWTLGFIGNDRLISGDDNGAIMLWDIEGRKLKQCRDKVGKVRQLAVAPRRDQVAVGDSAGQLLLWRFGTDERAQLLPTANETLVTGLEFSTDGKSLVSSSHKVVKVWDHDTTLRERDTFASSHPITSLTWLPGVDRFAMSTENGGMVVGDLKGRQQAFSDGSDHLYPSADFSPDGRQVAMGERFIFKAARGKAELLVRDLDTEATFRRWSSGHRVRCVCFGVGQQLLFSGGDDRCVVGWREDRDEPAQLPANHHDQVRSVLLQPGTHRVFSAGLDGKIEICDVELNERIDGFQADLSCLTSALSSNGELLAVGGFARKEPHLMHGVIAVWRRTFDIWEKAWESAAHGLGVDALAFSPSGALASGGRDQSVRIWDASSGTSNGAFQCHANVNFVAFSSDGRYLISGTKNRSLTIWEAHKRPHHDSEPYATLLFDHEIIAARLDGATEYSLILLDEAGKTYRYSLVRG